MPLVVSPRAAAWAGCCAWLMVCAWPAVARITVCAVVLEESRPWQRTADLGLAQHGRLLVPAEHNALRKGARSFSPLP